jgi:hypothetical protein
VFVGEEEDKEEEEEEEEEDDEANDNEWAGENVLWFPFPS